MSSLEIQDIRCEDLSNEVFQLGILLHPPESINEKFLIKLRDCVLKLPESHALKKWMKWIGAPKPLSEKQQTKRTFIQGLITSQFNLITDAKAKTEIINTLNEIPSTTLAEKVLRSYLFLMIGNITRSDNILREIMDSVPRINWEATPVEKGIFHRLAVDEFKNLLGRLSKHPADRRVFELFVLYLQNFYNDEALLEIVSDFDTSEAEARLGLKFTEGLAPSFVHYLRLSRMGENRRMRELRNLGRYPLEEQSYWVWPFIDISPLVSDQMNTELLRLEKNDELWFIYLMDVEKLSDVFSKAGRSFLPGRRPSLKKALGHQGSFMMSLYKLIELGDINSDLVNTTATHLIHE